ncbi:MAG TPA: sugar transferase [Acidisarcina sp.]|nr:sugar transferase [Acidisarcina sp.]
MSTDAIPPQPHESLAGRYPATLEVRSRPSGLSTLSLPIVEVACDFLLLAVGAVIGGMLGHFLQRSHAFAVTLDQLIAGGILYAVLFLSLLQGTGAYQPVSSLLHVKETEILLRTSIKAIMICVAGLVLARYPVPRMTVLSVWVVSTGTLIGGRLWLQDIVRNYCSPAFPKRRTLIYGSKRTARRFFTGAIHSPNLGIDPIGFVSSDGDGSYSIFSNDYYERDSKPVFHETVTAEMLERLAVEDIFVCDPDISDRNLATVRDAAREANCTISFVGNHQALAEKSPMWVWEMDGLLVATSLLKGPGVAYHVAKRSLDILLSAVLILVSAPVWGILALLIRLESKGPIFFRQSRVGRDGDLFEILKFRSMKVDAPKYACSPAHQADPRITRMGRFLRRSSLDEIPQLINVLKGDMSLVGPRPEMPFITEGYGPVEMTRLTVPQGITGLWQLSADRQYAIHESIEYDLYYIQNRTLLLDIAILLHTLVYAAKGV